MSRQIELGPELQQLLTDYVSIGQRFTCLADSHLELEMRLQKQQTELENYAKQLSAMRQTEMENQRILKSYNELKIDYDHLHSAAGIHREEIRAENNKRVSEMEEELKAVRAKASEQATAHQTAVNQIVSDYEAKLRDADAKIRQLSSSRNGRSYLNDVETAEKNKRFTQLSVQVKSGSSSIRGRGRARVAASKRKLFVSEMDRPTDIFE